MAILDRREPGVYISVEDRSYVQPTTEIGRTGYFVILCDRGPHNRIEEITSQSEFHELFGTPNFKKTSQTHYICDNFLRLGGTALVCRAVPYGWTEEADLAKNACIANSFIFEVNAPVDLGAVAPEISVSKGKYKFTTTSTIVYAYDTAAYNEIRQGYYIWLGTDDGDTYKKKVVLKYKDTDPLAISNKQNLIIVLEGNYTGSTNSAWAKCNYTTKDLGTEQSAPDEVADFSRGSVYVEIDATVQGLKLYRQTPLGSWIYPESLDYLSARQIVAKEEVLDDQDAVIGYRFKLDKTYGFGRSEAATPTIGNTAIKHYFPYVDSNISPFYDTSQFAPQSNRRALYMFHAIGAGSYYNALILIGSRNKQLEKQYLDSDDNIMYPYMFMDVALYKKNSDDSLTLLEGPWTVSLSKQTADNVIIRDFTTGNTLYIIDVINRNSKLIRAIDGNSVALDKLIYDDSAALAERRRLQVLLAFSTISSYSGTNNYAMGGVDLRNGSDGDGQYDSYGYLNPSAYMYGIISRCYDGSLDSYDGTVEQITDAIYPRYSPDYIVAAGFNEDVHHAAMELAMNRGDCMCITDTTTTENGTVVTSSDTDITNRENSYDWNSWNAMIYTQWRRQFDAYTGEHIWFSPVFHAMERHALVDALYFVSEPVAGIEKGVIDYPITLAYRPDHTTRGDLLDKELNYTIDEPDGTYFAIQFTTWKRLSILKRAHVAKFICYINKVIPTLLKDILQRKATQYWLNQAKFRVDTFLSYFLENPSLERYSTLRSFKTIVDFDDIRSELNVSIELYPIRAIERINVNIVVQ